MTFDADPFGGMAQLIKPCSSVYGSNFDKTRRRQDLNILKHYTNLPKPLNCERWKLYKVYIQ